MEIKYGLLVLLNKGKNDVEVVHFAGYEEVPNEDDRNHLRKELKEDLSLGLQDIIDKCIIVDASDGVVKYFAKVVAEQEKQLLILKPFSSHIENLPEIKKLYSVGSIQLNEPLGLILEREIKYQKETLERINRIKTAYSEIKKLDALDVEYLLLVLNLK